MLASAAEITKEIAKPFEGLRLSPYVCPAGVPTIGYGCIAYPDGRRVQLTDPPIDHATAEAMLDHEVYKACRAALRLCPVLITGAGCWGAVADFVFNLGAGRLQASTLRRRINEQDWPEARREMMRWVRGGGRVLSGLVRRRTAEALFIKGG